eukprot:g6590.t1
MHTFSLPRHEEVVKGGQSSALLKERHAIDKMLMLIQARGQHIEIVDSIGAEHTSKNTLYVKDGVEGSTCDLMMAYNGFKFMVQVKSAYNCRKGRTSTKGHFSNRRYVKFSDTNKEDYDNMVMVLIYMACKDGDEFTHPPSGSFSAIFQYDVGKMWILPGKTNKLKQRGVEVNYNVPVGMHMEEPINSDSLKFEKDTYSKFKALKLLGDVDYLDQSECGPVDFVTVDRGNQRELKWQLKCESTSASEKGGSHRRPSIPIRRCKSKRSPPSLN